MPHHIKDGVVRQLVADNTIQDGSSTRLVARRRYIGCLQLGDEEFAVCLLSLESVLLAVDIETDTLCGVGHVACYIAVTPESVGGLQLQRVLAGSVLQEERY